MEAASELRGNYKSSRRALPLNRRHSLRFNVFVVMMASTLWCELKEGGKIMAVGVLTVLVLWVGEGG